MAAGVIVWVAASYDGIYLLASHFIGVDPASLSCHHPPIVRGGLSVIEISFVAKNVDRKTKRNSQFERTERKSARESGQMER